MRAIGGTPSARRWLGLASLLVLSLPACADPEMPHLPPRAGRRFQSIRVQPPPTLEKVWSNCLVGARRTIAHGSVDCGELYDRPWRPRSSRQAALRCSYEAWLARKPFFARVAVESHVPQPYLLVGHADGSLSFFECDWFARVTTGPEFRCAEADVVFMRWAPACDSAEAPSPFGQGPRTELRRIDRSRL